MDAKDSEKQFINEFELDTKAYETAPKKNVIKRRPERKNDEEEENTVGPSVRKIPKCQIFQTIVNPFIVNEEDIYKENIPSADFYEKSFNHKDIVNGSIVFQKMKSD